ncbi:MAG TPA: MarR family transcriptional regulator [Amycolatopsis sp.]|uniref:MarR family winged helix-turn-helix transcriptional regulator n=1 Tax=Amycolatopsis sp. TaxID=37632 RepID=UPI002B47D2A6|nr:MarR family transcriptional regulator [Amycolatopsis sp.]HKS49710.1 MarR family transcriptional regulator [Amycolatopsis sp.]
MTDAGVVWERLRELVHETYDRRKEVSDALGMSFAKAKALRRIAAGPLTMRELAEQLVTDPPYATLLVDDLERRGLVERNVHPRDRRRKIVEITEAGREAVKTADRILGEPPPALQALPESDLAALAAILAKIGGAR